MLEDWVTFMECNRLICAILYHLYYFKNVKNTHGGVLLLVLKVTLLHWCFLRFLNCANSAKSRKAKNSSNNRKKLPKQRNLLYIDTTSRFLPPRDKVFS